MRCLHAALNLNSEVAKPEKKKKEKKRKKAQCSRYILPFPGSTPSDTGTFLFTIFGHLTHFIIYTFLSHFSVYIHLLHNTPPKSNSERTYLGYLCLGD
jgi:hypothetical protein